VSRGKTVKGKGKKLGRGRRLATGIDIGTFSVKIVGLAGDDAGNLNIRKITVVPLELPEPGALDYNLLEKQKAALKDAVKQHGKMEGKIVLGCPRDVSMFRYMTLPSSNPNEIREMLFFDVERHVPFPADDLEISYQVLEKTGDHETRIMMVCVPKVELEPYMKMFEELNIEIHAILPDVIGDSVAYSRTIRENETVAFLNFGRSSVNLGVVRGGELLFSRSLAISEDDLLKGFPRAKMWRDLQGRITAAGALNPNEREHFSEWLEFLNTELLRSISAFICEHEGVTVDRMILGGGAGYFPAGPPPSLGMKLKTRITVEPVLNGELPPSKEYQGPELTTPIGLALCGLDKAYDTLNLLPAAFIEEQESAQRSAFRKNVAVLSFMVFLLLGSTSYIWWLENHQDNTAIEDYYTELRSDIVELDRMNTKIQAVSSYLDKKNSCVNVLEDVLGVLSSVPKVYIRNITFSKRRTLEINGQVLSNEDFQTLLTALNGLRPSPTDETYFTNVVPNVRADNLGADTGNMQVWEFGFTCYLRWDDPKDRKKSQNRAS
jgi:Tfp pilus assembly PilM family ATPase